MEERWMMGLFSCLALCLLAWFLGRLSFLFFQPAFNLHQLRDSIAGYAKGHKIANPITLTNITFSFIFSSVFLRPSPFTTNLPVPLVVCLMRTRSRCLTELFFYRNNKGPSPWMEFLLCPRSSKVPTFCILRSALFPRRNRIWPECAK